MPDTGALSLVTRIERASDALSGGLATLDTAASNRLIWKVAGASLRKQLDAQEHSN